MACGSTTSQSEGTIDCSRPPVLKVSWERKFRKYLGRIQSNNFSYKYKYFLKKERVKIMSMEKRRTGVLSENKYLKCENKAKEK